jgi:hypothetical protein
LEGELDPVVADFQRDPEATYEGRTAAEWMTWARERRDIFDPSRWRSEDLWTDLASVTAWDYRQSH